MEKNLAKLERKESDEWLCPSTYLPSKDEILEKLDERKPRKKMKISVVVPNSVVKKRNSASARSLSKRKSSHMAVQKEEFRIDAETDEVEIIGVSNTKTPVSGTSKLRIISPAIPRTRNTRKPFHFSPPTLQVRQSPEQLFAALTSKREGSVEVMQAAPVKRRKEVENRSDEGEESESSEVSNVFDSISPNFSPIKSAYSPKETMFSLDFITGYEAQFTAFDDTKRIPREEAWACREKDNESGDLFDEEDDPMSIFEESEAQEARDLDESPMKIEVSPEKRKTVTFNVFDTEEMKEVKNTWRFMEPEEPKRDSAYRECDNGLDETGIMSEKDNDIQKYQRSICLRSDVKRARKTLRFVEPEERSVWRSEHNIEESCAPSILNGELREYAIDMETCGIPESSSPVGEAVNEAQKLNSESFGFMSHNSNCSSQEEEMYEKDELHGLAARLTSLMTSKINERRLLMSDLVFGTVPKDKLHKLDLCYVHSAFGMSILGAGSSSVIISRTCSIRRLSASCSLPSPAPLVCDPAPSSPFPAAETATAVTSFPSSSAPRSVVYSIGALSSSESTLSSTVVTTTIQDSQKVDLHVVVNPPLVTEGAI